MIYLEGELDAIQQKNSNIRREFEGELKRSSDEKLGMQEELAQLQSQGMRHTMELNNLKVKLEDARILKQELDSKKRELDEAANYKAQVARKDSVIARLRDELRKRDIELESKDEENILRVLKCLTADERVASEHKLINDCQSKGTNEERIRSIGDNVGLIINIQVLFYIYFSKIHSFLVIE